MIENFNESTEAVESSFPRFVGVSSIKVLAINPNNAKLRSLGWNVPEDASEPEYTTVNEKGEKQARIRIMAQAMDHPSEPIIPLDFWVRPELQLSAEREGEDRKCKVIDSYGRTAWVTKDQMKAHAIPEYANGPANIAPDYKPCHRGEESLVLFVMKYLNMTPYETFSNGIWQKAEKPGRFTIDNWDALCKGNIKEIAEAIAVKPDNRCKVIFGVRKTDDNKTYQTFYPNLFLYNNAKCNVNGNYAYAQKELDRFYKNSSSNNVYEANAIHEYVEKASQVEEKSQFDDDLPFFS